MDRFGTSRQHPKIGSVSLRMLWIPVVASILVAGYITLRPPQDERASATTVAAVKESAAPQPTIIPSDVTTREVDASPALPDEAIRQQQELDPVGAGHDIPR